LSLCQDGGLQCPTCKSIYGVKRGDCPQGTMSYRAISNQLPGYEGYGAIEIIYHITSGYQVTISVTYFNFCTLTFLFHSGALWLFTYLHFTVYFGCSLQCFDAVGWTAGEDLHMTQLMSHPLTVSWFSKSSLVSPFWYWLTWIVLGKGPLNWCCFVVVVVVWLHPVQMLSKAYIDGSLCQCENATETLAYIARPHWVTSLFGLVFRRDQTSD